MVAGWNGVTDSAESTWGRLGHLRHALPGRKVDEQGELLSVPLPLTFVWLVLGVLTVLEAINDTFGFGPDWVFDNWVHNVILGASAALVLARAAFEPVARKAWIAFGTGLALWFLGSVAWDVFYSGNPDPPYPSFADALWLAWYPLLALGIYFLIRVRVPQFELHRWMDGIAVTLLVLAVGFALVIQPATQHKTVGSLATFVVFLYPVLDVLLIGAICLVGALIFSYDLGAELLNYGALLAFMGVNLSSVVRGWRHGRWGQWVPMLMSTTGMVTCFILWINLGPMAKWVGSGWALAGFLLWILRRNQTVLPGEAA